MSAMTVDFCLIEPGENFSDDVLPVGAQIVQATEGPANTFLVFSGLVEIVVPPQVLKQKLGDNAL